MVMKTKIANHELSEKVSKRIVRRRLAVMVGVNGTFFSAGFTVPTDDVLSCACFL